MFNKIIAHLKELAQSQIDELKLLLIRRFLHFSFKKKKKLEESILKIELDLKRTMKDIESDPSIVLSVQTLVMRYKDTCSEHEELLNQCHRIENTIRNFTHFNSIDAISFSNFSFDNKRDFLALLDWVVCFKSTINFLYNEGEKIKKGV